MCALEMRSRARPRREVSFSGQFSNPFLLGRATDFSATTFQFLRFRRLLLCRQTGFSTSDHRPERRWHRHVRCARQKISIVALDPRRLLAKAMRIR